MKTDLNTHPRLVVYGIGQYGQYIVRYATKKGWPIIAVYNRAGDKVGKDAGLLAGLDKALGVIVQDCDKANYQQLDADIAVVTTTDRLADNFQAYERLLTAGLNVLDHGGEAINPYAIDQQIAEKIDQLALNNNVTFTGSGNWDMSRIWSGILSVGPCVEIDTIHHSSLANTADFSKEIMIGTGTGMTVEEFQEKVARPDSPMTGLYKIVPEMLAQAIGYTVTSCIEKVVPAVLDRPVYCERLGRELEAGLCAGWVAMIEVETEEGLKITGEMAARIFFKEDDFEHTAWEVKGEPDTKVVVYRSTHANTIFSLFNRIPDVINAESGIRLISELGPLKHTALLG